MKKNLKKFVFEKIAEKGYVSDAEAYSYYGEGLNLCTLEELKTKAKNYQNDFNFFKDLKITAKRKIGRRYLLEVDGGTCYQARKEYWDTVTI